MNPYMGDTCFEPPADIVRFFHEKCLIEYEYTNDSTICYIARINTPEHCRGENRASKALSLLLEDLKAKGTKKAVLMAVYDPCDYQYPDYETGLLHLIDFYKKNGFVVSDKSFDPDMVTNCSPVNMEKTL